MLKAFRLTKIMGDRFAGEWPREAFRSHGIAYNVADKDRSALYLELLASVNSASVGCLTMPSCYASCGADVRPQALPRATSGYLH